MIYGIVIGGGIGDLITYQARLNSLLKEEDQAKFFIIGGFPKSVELQKQILDVDPRVSEIQIGSMGSADRILDWRPDYAPLGYPIQIPFEIPLPAIEREATDNFFEKEKLLDAKTVIIQPRTTEGNQFGFEAIRHWEDRKWQELVGLISERGLKIVQVGAKSDRLSLNGTLDLTGRTSILQAIALILKANLCIGINSWVWQVACYAGHPTSVIWLHNHFWIPLHVPEKRMHLSIFEKPEATPQEVLDGIWK